MGDFSSDDGAALAFFGCYFLFALVVLVVTIFVLYKVIQKTGRSGWLALLVLVPFGNIGLMIWLAFSDWPILQELRALRARVGYMPPAGGYYPPSGGYAAPDPYQAPSYAPVAPQPPAAPAPPQTLAEPVTPPSPPSQPPYQG